MSDATRTCPNSGGTVSRWHSPNLFNAWGDHADPPAQDPGPYQEGETTSCPGCEKDVAVSHRVVSQRETGTQYVGTIAEH
jgi:hypothetical protein